MRSTNPREVGLIFQSYARKIHAKSSPKDPHFVQISIACGKASQYVPRLGHALMFSVQIEQWNEQHYPSFVLVVSNQSGSKSMMDPSDPRARIVELENHLEAELAKKRRIEDIRAGVATNGIHSANGEREALMFVAAAMVLILSVTGGVVWGVLKIF